MIESGSGRVGGASGCPTIPAGIISAAGVKIGGRLFESSPDDHFTVVPDRSVPPSGIGRVGGAGRSPPIRTRTISAASVKTAAIFSTPDDHFTARPHCGVTLSPSGCAGGVGGCPIVGIGLYLPPVIKPPDPPQTIISLPVHTAV